MYSGDDYSHHPWKGHAFKRTTQGFSESLAGLLYHVVLLLFEWLLTLCHPIINALLDA